MNLILFVFHPHLTKCLQYNRFPNKVLVCFMHVGTYELIVLDNVSHSLAKIGRIAFSHVMNKAIRKRNFRCYPIKHHNSLGETICNSHFTEKFESHRWKTKKKFDVTYLVCSIAVMQNYIQNPFPIPVRRDDFWTLHHQFIWSFYALTEVKKAFFIRKLH